MNTLTKPLLLTLAADHDLCDVQLLCWRPSFFNDDQSAGSFPTPTLRQPRS